MNLRFWKKKKLKKKNVLPDMGYAPEEDVTPPQTTHSFVKPKLYPPEGVGET